MSKHFHISYNKERRDSIILAEKIKDSKWVDSNTIIVNCSPDYSSYLCQIINHKISLLNDNDLFEVIELPMPYPTHSQVWDTLDREFKGFERYLHEWVRRYISPSDKYLFIDSGTLRGKNFTRVKNAISYRVPLDNMRFASLYLQSDSIFTPDFYVQKFDREKDGGLVFDWENLNNPNWDY